MAVKFQSDEYFEAANAAMQSSEEVLKEAKGRNVAIQVVTTDYPGIGEKRTFLRIDDGQPSAGPGELDDVDATIRQNYETAVALDKGEISPQTAFMEGKIKIKGNLMKMMQLQRFLQTLGPAAKHIEREYEEI